MIVQVAEKRKITENEIDRDFDGQWVLFIKEGHTSVGQIIAYGTEGVKDRENLRLLNLNKFNGDGLVLYGFAERGGDHLHGF